MKLKNKRDNSHLQKQSKITKWKTEIMMIIIKARVTIIKNSKSKSNNGDDDYEKIYKWKYYW